jgi:RHS repeat-associated core domain
MTKGALSRNSLSMLGATCVMPTRGAAAGTQTPMFDRGFTGHEHLHSFDLININGRMYDPIVDRMLSPDIVIQQEEHNSQSYNRYSYCFNNPLRFTDPAVKEKN